MFVLFGCAAAAILALSVDQLLALMESGVSARRRGRVISGAVGLLVIVSLAFVPSFSRGQKSSYVIGAKPFAEQYILGSLIGERIAAADMSAVLREGLGSAVVFDALAAGNIDIYVEYSGTIWANQMKRRDVRPREQVLAEVKQWLQEKHGVTLVGGLGFENAYTLAITKKRAQQDNIKTLGDLARFSANLSIASDYEFFGRPEWQALRATYGLLFKEQKTMQPEFMYPAVAAGDVDVISAYTSDGRVKQYDLATIADDRNAIPPYDAIILISPKRANDAALIEAVKPLVGKINVELMREANARAAGDKAEQPQAVAQWLWQQIGK